MPNPTEASLDDLVDFHDTFQLADKPQIPRSASALAYENEQLKRERDNWKALALLGGWTN